MTTLSHYLQQTGQTLSAFAALIGCKPNYLSEIASGRRKPSLKLAVEIFTASHGTIPPESWVSPVLLDRQTGQPLSQIARVDAICQPGEAENAEG